MAVRPGWTWHRTGRPTCRRHPRPVAAPTRRPGHARPRRQSGRRGRGSPGRRCRRPGRRHVPPRPIPVRSCFRLLRKWGSPRKHRLTGADPVLYPQVSPLTRGVVSPGATTVGTSPSAVPPPRPARRGGTRRAVAQPPRPVRDTGGVASAAPGILTAQTAPDVAQRAWPRWLALGLAMLVVAAAGLLWPVGGARLLLGAAGAFLAVRGVVLFRAAGTGAVDGRARLLGAGAAVAGGAGLAVAVVSAAG